MVNEISSLTFGIKPSPLIKGKKLPLFFASGSKGSSELARTTEEKYPTSLILELDFLISSIFLESGNYQLNLNTQGMSISIYVEPPILNYKSYTKDITIGGYVNHTLNKDSKWVMTLSDYADLVESHKSKFAKEFQKSKKGINDTENGNETTIPDFTPCDVLPEPVGGLERLFNRVVYPDSAIIEGIEGQVFVRVYVDEDGFIQKTEILKGIPDSGLDQAAIDAINKTYFLPGELNGKSVGAWVSLPFTFKLQDE